MERFTEHSSNIDKDSFRVKPNMSMYKSIDKLGKLEYIEEQIGCPLEVRCKIYEGKEIYDEKGNKMRISEVYRYTFEAYNIEYTWDRVELSYRDYKKTWWLKEDRSE